MKPTKNQKEWERPELIILSSAILSENVLSSSGDDGDGFEDPPSFGGSGGLTGGLSGN